MVKSFSHLNKGEIIGDSQSQLAEDYVQLALIRYFTGLSLLVMYNYFDIYVMRKKKVRQPWGQPPTPKPQWPICLEPKWVPLKLFNLQMFNLHYVTFQICAL